MGLCRLEEWHKLLLVSRDPFLLRDFSFVAKRKTIRAANQDSFLPYRFEAFDEPWKHSFDTTYDKWEPFWGLMDQDRNLKKGLVIPDCGGAQAKVFM